MAYNGVAEQIVLAGGCFWCTEAMYKDLKGVISVKPGYAGGNVVNPTYKEVCTGETGHAEVIIVEYDPTTITYDTLLEIFWGAHNPTELNRQGVDVGTQYRSAIFYETDEQKQKAYDSIKNIAEPLFGVGKVVTTVEKLINLTVAEDYHHDYLKLKGDENSYCQAVVNPKVAKFRKNFKKYLM